MWLPMLKIRRRLLRWGLLALGLPLAARLLHSAADLLESRQGATPAVRNLHRAGGAVEAVQDSIRGKSSRRGSRRAATSASTRDKGSQPGPWQ